MSPKKTTDPRWPNPAPEQTEPDAPPMPASVRETAGHNAAAIAIPPHKPPKALPTAPAIPAVLINQTEPLPLMSAATTPASPPDFTVPLKERARPTVHTRRQETTVPGLRTRERNRTVTIVAAIIGVGIAAAIGIVALGLMRVREEPTSTSITTPTLGATATATTVAIPTASSTPTPSPSPSLSPSPTPLAVPAALPAVAPSPSPASPSAPPRTSATAPATSPKTDIPRAL